jgi:hypothetical protein
MDKVKLKTFRVIVGFEGVEHVYLVKAQYNHHAKRLVFCGVKDPPWKDVLDELYARYPLAQGDAPVRRFTGNNAQISWGITPSTERCGLKPKWLYSLNRATGAMMAV